MRKYRLGTLVGVVLGMILAWVIINQWFRPFEGELYLIMSLFFSLLMVMLYWSIASHNKVAGYGALFLFITPLVNYLSRAYINTTVRFILVEIFVILSIICLIVSGGQVFSRSLED